MKVYQCDSCKEITSNPHDIKMKEFVWFFDIDGCCRIKEKRKIHLCDKCFRGLSKIAETNLKEKKKEEI